MQPSSFHLKIIQRTTQRAVITLTAQQIHLTLEKSCHVSNKMFWEINHQGCELSFPLIHFLLDTLRMMHLSPWRPLQTEPPGFY